MKRLKHTIVILSVVMLLATVNGRASDEQAVDRLLELLIKRGVITTEEADAVRAEYDGQAEETHQAEPVPPAVGGEIAKAAVTEHQHNDLKGVRDLKIGMLSYLSYQDGSKLDGGGAEDYSQLKVKRAYIDIRKELNDHLDVRITPDVHLDSSGDLKVRLKYLYARFGFSDTRLLNHPHIELGVAHMPWLDFEEHINLYRMQDTMFMERNGLFNSADMGILFASKLGPDLDDEHLKYTSSHYAGRWGSFGVGIFNGGGYHASEKNDNKVLEGRFTLRPLPDALPGFQVSVFGISGKGNQSDAHSAVAPDWQVGATMLSYESPRLVLTAQYADGKGNQKGSAVDEHGNALPFDGYSLFTEVRLGRQQQYSLIGRYEVFDHDTDDPHSDQEKRFIAGVAWQYAKGNYWLLDYDRVKHSIPGLADEDRFQLTLQIKY